MDALEVEGHEQEHAEESRGEQELGQVRPAPDAVEQDAQGEQGVAGPRLEGHEGDEEDDASGHEPDRRG